MIPVPSLADRKSDIKLLTDKFLVDISQEYGTKVKKVNNDVISYFESLPWSGNIRELRNVIERLFIMNSSDEIDLDCAKRYID